MVYLQQNRQRNVGKLTYSYTQDYIIFLFNKKTSLLNSSCTYLVIHNIQTFNTPCTDDIIDYNYIFKAIINILVEPVATYTSSHLSNNSPFKTFILLSTTIYLFRYELNGKPGKENTKDRGKLEVRIGFIVRAGSLTDLTKKERHKSSLGQLSSAAQSFGGSLLSIGSLEKRKGLKKLAKSIGSKVKGKSKSKNRLDDINDEEEFRVQGQRPRTAGQEQGEADPGVVSDEEDEFTVSDVIFFVTKIEDRIILQFIDFVVFVIYVIIVRTRLMTDYDYFVLIKSIAA